MNRLNLSKAAELYGARVVEDGSHIAFQTALNRAYGFRLRPTALTDDHLNMVAAQAMLALPALDHVTHQINTDARLSASGRAEKLKPARLAAIKAIATAAADVRKHGQALKAREDEFYTVPQLAPADTAGAIQDRSVIDHLMAQPPGKRMTIIAGMGERQLVALRRSLIPLEAAEDAMARDMYRAAVEKRAPAKAAELKLVRETHDELQNAVADAAQYIQGRAIGLTAAEISEGARDTGGESIFFDGMRTDHAA